ncbi:hypothetical protein AAFF27_03095 [Xylophilus sp. GW821-FHT01B05]
MDEIKIACHAAKSERPSWFTRFVGRDPGQIETACKTLGTSAARQQYDEWLAITELYLSCQPLI